MRTFKKLVLILIISVMGTMSVQANCASDRYLAKKKLYLLYRAISYYQDYGSMALGGSCTNLNMYNDSEKCNDLVNIYKEAQALLDKGGISGFKVDSVFKNNIISVNGGVDSLSLASTLISTAGINLSSSCSVDEQGNGKTEPLFNNDDLNEITSTLAQHENLHYMLREARTLLRGASISRDCTVNGKSCRDDYDDLMEETKIAFDNFCDWSKKHSGTTYYLQMGLRLVCYAGLALAVILSALDFIQAITSNDDGALNKAFQKTMKRLAAVAVIFLANLIVQLVLGLVTRLPYYNAEYSEVCSWADLSKFSGNNVEE